MRTMVEISNLFILLTKSMLSTANIAHKADVYEQGVLIAEKIVLIAIR